MTYIHKNGSETGTIVLQDYELGISDAAYIYTSISGIITPLKTKEADNAISLGGLDSSGYVKIDGSQDMVGALKVNYDSKNTTIDNTKISQDDGANQTVIFTEPHTTLERRNGNTPITTLELRDDSKAYVNTKQVWTEGNQGSGSGLDADLLDGFGGEQSLLYKGDIPDNEDLNNYIIAGMYHQNSNDYANNGTNYPEPNAGMLTVKADGNMVYQEYWVYSNNNKKYIRTSYNGTWESWKLLADTDYVDSLINNACPSGAIIMWAGSSVPSGWALCDGNNGTPDLRNRFIYGTDLNGIGNFGGSADAVVVSHNHNAVVHDPGHFHTTEGNWGQHNVTHDTSYAVPGLRRDHDDINNPLIQRRATGVTVSIDDEGESGVGKNLPPYYTLAYIMKL